LKNLLDGAWDAKENAILCALRKAMMEHVGRVALDRAETPVESAFRADAAVRFDRTGRGSRDCHAVNLLPSSGSAPGGGAGSRRGLAFRGGAGRCKAIQAAAGESKAVRRERQGLPRGIVRGAPVVKPLQALRADISLDPAMTRKPLLDKECRIRRR